MVARDKDGIQNNFDNCEVTPNPDQLDTDKDGLGTSSADALQVHSNSAELDR